MRILKFKYSVTALFSLVQLLVGFAAVRSQAQSIYEPYAFTNFAGQPGGPGLADGLGRGARFKSPTATAVDAGGNVYVADSLNFTIRRITPAGVVTTIAGVPLRPGTNDGPATLARFGSTVGLGGPTGVAVDTATNVYVADTPNSIIRKITFSESGAVVSTFAGSPGRAGTDDGTGTAARFSTPGAMTTDSAGNIYVVDGFAIRRLTPAGVVTTLAGSVLQPGTADGTNGVARFGANVLGGPKGLALDSAGNIYVTDPPNSTIRKIAPVGGNWVVTTFAGVAGESGFTDGAPGVARLFNPHGIAMDSSGRIYFSEGSEIIRKLSFNGSAWVVSSFAGAITALGSEDGIGAAARFQLPEGLSADSAGNLYLADFGNNTIRKITPAAEVTTLAGQAGGSGSADGLGSVAQFRIPHSVAVDKAGNLYVSDTSGNTIRKITPDGLVTTIAGSPEKHGYSDGVGTAQAAQFNSPLGISADASGNLYVGDNANQTVRKITTGGVVTTLAGQVGVKGSAAGSGANAAFNSPNGTAPDSHGNVFVADSGNRVIRKISEGGSVTLFAGSIGLQGLVDGTGTLARFNSPKGLAIDRSENIYVVDGNAIRKITPAGGVSTLAGASQSGSADADGIQARFLNPESVAVDTDGNVYVSDTANHTIRKISPGGTVRTLAGLAGQSGADDGTNSTARFSSPRGIGVDSAGIIYVADAGNSIIRKLVMNGTDAVVTTLAGTAGQTESIDATGAGARFHFPHGLAVDAGGNVYVTDRSNDDIRKITPSGVVTTFAGLPRAGGSADGSGGGATFYDPEDLAVDGSGNIFVAEFGNRTVRKISPSGTNWIVTTIAGCASCPKGTNDGPGLAARFYGPFGLAVDQAGNVFVGESDPRTIRKLTPSGADWTVTTFAGAPFQPGTIDGPANIARLNGPLGLDTDPAGNLYVSDSGSIRKISPGGLVTTLAGCSPCSDALGSVDGPGSVARFSFTRDVAVDAAGNLYVADAGNHLIRKLSFNGTDWMVTTLGGLAGQASGAEGIGIDARFNQPTGIAVDSAGNLYVVNSGENSIVKGVPAGTTGAADLRFDPGAGGLALSNGTLQLSLSAPSASGTIIMDVSTNLVSWAPIQTNSLSASSLKLSLPFETKENRFFRARFFY